MVCRDQREDAGNLPCMASMYHSRLTILTYTSLRNFASSQTLGLDGARYKKYHSRAQAQEAFDRAKGAGDVRKL